MFAFRNLLFPMLKTTFLGVCLLSGSLALAQSTVSTYQPPVFTDPDRVKKIEAAWPVIEKLYQDYATKQHFPGMAYGLVVDGKLLKAGATGYTDLAKKTLATPASLFRIASMTKSLTAMAILKLRDEGKLRLDDPAEQYVPQLKKLRYLTTDSPRITVRNLLTHSAGFPEDNPYGDRQLGDSEAELTRFLDGGVSLSNVPGVAYEYSNLGFVLLGRILTNVTGKPYQQYITESILKPLGMTNTRWEYTQVPAGKLAHGYRWQGNEWLEEELLHDGSHGAMGGLITSIDDFSKYMAVHQQAWPPRSGTETGPVRRSSVREMQQPWTFSYLNGAFRYPDGRACPMTSSYAYGLRWSHDCGDRVYVGHTGGLPGFGSQWWVMPEYGIGVVAYGNLTYASMGSVNWAVLDTLIRSADLKPRQLPVSPILAQRKAELVKLLPDWTNAERSGIFAENVFPDRSVALRRQEAQALFNTIGKVTSVGELIPENQLRGTFRLTGERGAVDVFFTLTPEIPALIQQLDLREVKR
ncbi:CubicO group peptidase (beta-lactamase class C family) [Spirosoma oryzae]|uniref:CubicO group peptidase (Beta-lactamase class C family) n=2 Tax=Spirosoma oryzae TaxID=1469603 RepID=A0A2T0SCC3_9BACT|nr:CubicO group peptidase (beta-lactamase class C family) [Spirosoma oryzae]